MKILFHALIFSLASFVPTMSYADPGNACHFHGSKVAAETTIVQCANQRKETLVKANKLEKSWGPIKHDSIAYVDGKKGKEWKVVFNNPQAPDQTKTYLFMFFTPPGNFIAANYSGQ